MVSAQNDEEKKVEPTKRPSWSSGLPERETSNDLSKPEFKPKIDSDIELDMSEFGIQPKAEIELDLPINATLSNDQESTAETTINTESAPEMVTEAEPVETQPIETQPVVTQPEPMVEEIVVEQPIKDVPAPDSIPVKAEPVVEVPLQDEMVESPVISNTTVQDTNQVPVELEADSTVDNIVSEDPQPTAAIQPEPEPEPELPVSSPAEEVVLAESNEVGNYEWVIIQQEPVKYPVKAAINNLEGWVEVEVVINPSGKVVSASAVKYSSRGRVFGKPAIQSVNGWLFEPPSNVGINTNLTRIYKVEFNL